MQEDFHYYATYCAAFLAGYSHEESLAIAYSAQFVDLCSLSFLKSIDGPEAAATTQLKLEMMDTHPDPIGLQTITRIWASFHFLPYDLYATRKKCSRSYLNKYRLICRPNGSLITDTIELAKDKGLEACGLAMHVLADTWAHQNFAGTPSYVINNTYSPFTELIPDGDGFMEKPIFFRHSPGLPDDIDRGFYTNTISQSNELSVMNLGHGRAGHLPDYSFIRYRYMPAWADYDVFVKDNPSDYYHAFCQMIYAMKYLRGDHSSFERDTYDFEAAAPYEQRINEILTKRQLDACADWKAFGEELTGQVIPPFDIDLYRSEYKVAGKDDKDNTFLGRFFLAAMSQKSMVTNRIFRSGSLLAGFSVDFNKKGFWGIRDFIALIRANRKEAQK